MEIQRQWFLERFWKIFIEIATCLQVDSRKLFKSLFLKSPLFGHVFKIIFLDQSLSISQNLITILIKF